MAELDDVMKALEGLTAKLGGSGEQAAPKATPPTPSRRSGDAPSWVQELRGELAQLKSLIAPASSPGGTGTAGTDPAPRRRIGTGKGGAGDASKSEGKPKRKGWFDE